MRIALVGPYPPPFGGVSIHVKRLHSAFAARGISATVFAQSYAPGDSAYSVVYTRRGASWYLRRALLRDFDIVHLHTFETDFKHLLASGILASVGARLVVTLHSFRDEPVTRTRRYRTLVPWALHAFDHIIAVGPEVREAAIKWGADPMQVSVIPSYLPPVPNDEDRAKIPVAIQRFLATRTPLISANAYRLSFFQGQDLYGLDLCVELCKALKAGYPQIGFVFLVGKQEDSAYLDSIVQRIHNYGIEDHFCIASGNTEFWPIIEKSSIMVRPTNTDSYGISVAEAIDLGVPAIASDVCQRPAGTLLFRSRDLFELMARTEEVLENEREHRQRLQQYRNDVNTPIDQIIRVYKALLS